MSEPLRVAMVNLTGGGFSGGYRKYLQQLVPRLAAQPGVQLHVMSPPGAGELLADSVLNGSIIAHVIDPRAARSKLRDQLDALQPDVVFVPTARYVSMPGVPTVCMVRNMEPLATPFGGNAPVDALKNLARRAAARTACRRATRIIAVSDYVRAFLTDEWDVPGDRITVVHHGVEEPLAADAAVRPDTITLPADTPFLFTAGSLRPARGLEDLIDALAILLREATPVHAVIAGSGSGQTARYLRSLRKRIHSLGLDPWVTWAGELDAPRMAWCFRNSAAFVMTTRAEACPNTALEALAYGARIIATDAPPLPEICADAALYYRAGNGGDLAAHIRSALADTAWQERTRIAALERATHFDWDVTAALTIAALRQARTA